MREAHSAYDAANPIGSKLASKQRQQRHEGLLQAFTHLKGKALTMADSGVQKIKEAAPVASLTKVERATGVPVYVSFAVLLCPLLAALCCIGSFT